MRVVVTGATGLVGLALVRRLLDGGCEVTALTRSVERARPLLPARCRVAAWDPASGRLASDALRGVDAVVHLAGEGVADGRWSVARKAAIRNSRVLGTHAVVEALRALPPAERPRVLVSASAIGIYGDRGDEVLAEGAAAGTGFLADVCHAWEREAFAADAFGVRVVALRIGIVLARGGGALARMLPLFRLGVAGRLGSGRQWMSWIHLDDLVGMLVFALRSEEVRGVLNAVAPAPVTNAAFTRALAGVVRRPALLPAPALGLRLALGEMATVLLASQRVVPAEADRLGFSFVHPDLDGALAALATDPAEILEREQWIPAPPDAVFPFFGEARNLEAITPPFLRFRVLRTSTAGMTRGTTIDYRLVLHGVPIRWRSVIDAWEPPRRFVDSQARGPYRLWEHTHAFEPWAGGTLVRDRVRYALPFGGLGTLVAGGLVARDLDAIFAYRHARIAERFPTPRAAA